jgi:CubicO group peptidase (beta-lactamase class C family)
MSGGLSKTRLARVHAVMTGYVERGDVPGIVTLISRRGEVHVDAIGTLALGGSVPMRHDTIFRIAGLRRDLRAARTRDRPAARNVRERLFEPLGMKDTGFSVPEPKLDRLATCYRTDTTTGGLALFDEARGGAYSRPPRFPSELVSTADDYLAFGQMLLNHGRHGRERILSRPSVELMTTDQLTPAQRAGGEMILGADRSWGLGLAVVVRRGDLASVPGRFGWDGGCGTSWASDPKEDLVGILMTQRLFDSPSPPAVYLDFWTSTYQAIDD